MKRRQRRDVTGWGGPIGRVRATLSVTGDDLEPREVTALLHRRPSFAARKGEQIDRAGHLVFSTDRRLGP